MSGDCACAPFPWVVVVAPCCHSTPFLLSCQKKRCRAAKEKRFEASTLPWWAHPPLPFGSKPQRDKLVRQVGLYMVSRPGAQVSLTQSAVMLGLRVRGRGGWDPTPPVAAPLSAFLWGSTPFLCARAKKWGGTGSRGRRLLPRETAHTHNPPTSAKAPPPSRAKMSPVYRGSSAHADGGAAGVKKRFSLAARHRFFGQAPKKWGRKAAGGSDHHPA